MNGNLTVILVVSLVVLAALMINPRTRPLVQALVNLVMLVPRLINFVSNLVILLAVGAIVYVVATNLPTILRLADAIQGLARWAK